MIPVEWPIAAVAADPEGEPARTAGRDRLPSVRADLFLDDRARLTEQERALMSAMLGTLVEQIADEIRLGLPHALLAHAEPDRDRITGRLWRSSALDRPELVLLLLSRADEQLIATACRDSRRAGNGSTVEALVGDQDGAVASAAMALALARGRRRDRFGRLGLELDDLPREEVHRLVHLVAAEMRSGVADRSLALDEALAGAAERLAARHDPQRQVEARASSLAEALVAARGADDGLIAALAEEGDAAMVAALCAVRAGIALDTAWMLLVDDGARDAMLLARMAGVGRPAAAALVAALAEPLLWGEPERAIACYDRPTAADIDAAVRWWRLPRTYRESRRQQGGGDG